MLVDLLLTFLGVFASFLATFLLGNVIYKIVFEWCGNQKMQFSEIIPFSIGILFLFMINSTWARFFGGTESINILFGFMATIIVSLFTIFDLLSKNIEYLKTFIKSSFLISTLVTWIFLIPILEDSRREVLFGITSLGNNDLPLYAQLSMHNLNYGFRGEGQISPISGTIEAGKYLSNYTYIGTIAVIDFLSAFFSFNVIQATSLTLMISVGFVFMSLRHLGNILNLNSNLSNLLASIGILLPVSLYSISMGFIGALFGIASFAVMISGSLSFAKKQISEQEFILIMTLGLSIGIYTYAQISIPILVALSFFHKINNILEEKKGRKYQLVKYYGMAGFLGILLSFSAIPNLITLTKVLSGEGFGWKLQFFDPIDVFLSIANISNQNSPSLLLLWSPFLIFITYKSFKNFHTKSGIYESLLLYALFLSPILFLIKYGSNGYQTWKLVTYISPIFIMLFFSIVSRYRNVIYLYLCFLIFIPFILWKPVYNQSTHQITSKDMFDAANFVNSLSSTSINVDAGDFWPSMSVASLIERKSIAINSITYAPSKTNLGTCTIVNRTHKYYDSLSPIYKNSEFAVVNFPQNCT